MVGFAEVGFVLMALVGIAFWALLLWLAWVLVSSVRGIRSELVRIRQLLDEGLVVDTGRGPDA